MPPPKYKGLNPILYSLKQRYGSPLEKGIFSLTNSSVYSSTVRQIEYILNWDYTDGWQSANIENQSFVLDFKENYVLIKSYGLKPMYRDHVPTEWMILRSNDNKNWVPIDYRKENPCEGHMAFRDNNYPDALFCMNDISQYYDSQIPGYFHMIKMQQIGYNSAINYKSTENDCYFFYLGAFEIYGEIRNLMPCLRTLTCHTNRLYLSLLFIIISIKTY